MHVMFTAFFKNKKMHVYSFTDVNQSSNNVNICYKLRPDYCNVIAYAPIGYVMTNLKSS